MKTELGVNDGRGVYWFSHSSSWRTGVVSGLLFGPLFFPLMYLLATCVLPFSPFVPFALMAAPAAAASVVRARTIWRTSKRSWPKTIFVFIVTYWPEALILKTAVEFPSGTTKNAKIRRDEENGEITY